MRSFYYNWRQYIISKIEDRAEIANFHVDRLGLEASKASSSSQMVDARLSSNSIWDRSERIISQILTDFPKKSQEYPSSLASKILDNLSICFLALPVESLEMEVSRDISRHRGFIEGTLPLLRALSTMKFSSANSFEDESDLFDIKPDEGFVKMKVHQKMCKQHRQKPQHAGINTSLFARLDVAVPTTSNAATALSTHILAELKQVLSLYLLLLRWTELADDIKALLFPNVEESAKDVAPELSSPKDVESSTESKVYPMVQPMKAALYFDNADGFGEWRILEIFKNIFKTIRHLLHGHFSSDNQKRLDGTDAGIPVFEAKLTKDLWLVYQIDCIPDQDGESERQVIKVYGIYKHSELGRIWNALGNHLARKGAEYCRRCIFRTKAANNVILPASFPPAEPEPEIPASPLDLSAKDMDDVESSHLAGPREIRNILAVSYRMYSVILISHSRKRSHRKRRHTPRLHALFSRMEGRQMHHVVLCLGSKRHRILGIQRAWESSGIDMPKPCQIFVTKSRTLATKVGEDFTRLLKSLTLAGSTLQELAKLKAQSILNDLVDHDDAPESQMNIPMRYSQLEDKHFPLFVTFDQLAKMIAADVFDMDDPKMRRSAELFFTTDDAETHDSLVTYNIFKNQYWPHFPQGLTKNLSSAASFAIHGWFSASFWASTNLYPIKQLLNPHIGIIKGSEQALSCPDGVLDRSSYLCISRRSNPISANHMDSVYNIFEIYKKFKKYKYHLNVADRMHTILKVLGDWRFPGRQIDYLYVDEAQDNLLIDALVLRRLCRNPDGLFWAADTVQAISAGSSFRFNDLKVFIYCVEQQSILVNSARAPVHQPTMFQLGMNYRSHGGIVNCAHSVIELITKFWPDSIDHLQPEKGMVDGVKPIFFMGPDDDTCCKQFLVGERDELGPNQCILVRNDAACQKLREQVGDIGIIMTLYESKGLEFDDVLLYGFFEDSVIDVLRWRVILNGVDSQGYAPDFYHDETRYAGICSELKHLYSDAMHIFWTSRNLIQNCAHDSDIPPLVVSFNPEEWASSGRSLFLHKLYSQAMHCFQHAGRLREVKVCEAYLLRETARSSIGVASPNVQQKAFITAADAFADCGAAATGNEKCQYYHTLAACYVRGGEDLKAADTYLVAQEFGLAVKRYRKAGSFDRTLCVLTDYCTMIPEETATALWTACRLYYCRKSNNQAPLSLFSSSDEELEFLEAHGLDYARVSLLESHSRYYEVAELHLSENRPMEAAQAFLEDNRNADSAACAADALLESLWCKYSFRITRAAVPDDSVQHSIALTNQLQMLNTKTIPATSTIPLIPKPEFIPRKVLPLTQTSTIATPQPAIIPNPLIVLPPPVIALFTPSQLPIIMSNASKGINAMPGANSTRVLSFNGKTSELLEFFELFEDLATACALTDAEKCKLIVRYVNLQTKRFWVTLIGYESKNFTAFKDSILARYSRAAKGQRYSIHDLERVVINSVDNEISTETELLQYYRQFCPVAHWLVANGKISTCERDRYFWQGLPATTRHAIDRQLELKDANYLQTEATDFEEVLKAGRFVFSDDTFDADLNEPIATRIWTIREGRTSRVKAAPHWDSDNEEERKDARREVQTKRVAFTPSPPAPVKNTIDEVKALAWKMHGLDIGDITYSGCYTRLIWEKGDTCVPHRISDFTNALVEG
ncbi:uncharacterized protein EDB91DRAFT_1257152 [Suillus paluster]|uniref:uncharacterized protein n=1 Tax=Suillus paluster TaxID=48578 RepID=UPI001B86D0AC|nr:uncharacterized protein EDB91DRAFT_1257152 [Suillus paluster]KAG1720128.1 hypothetical protein EDB91DRAFT_1257152 [Suillus paluster]